MLGTMRLMGGSSFELGPVAAPSAGSVARTMLTVTRSALSRAASTVPKLSAQRRTPPSPSSPTRTALRMSSYLSHEHFRRRIDARRDPTTYCPTFSTREIFVFTPPTPEGIAMAKPAHRQRDAGQRLGEAELVDRRDGSPWRLPLDLPELRPTRIQ